MNATIRVLSWLALTFLATRADAQLVGTWAGSFEPRPVFLPIVGRFSRPDGRLTAEFQTPNSSPVFNPVDVVVVEKSHVTIVQSRLNALFNLDLSGNELSGTLRARGDTAKLTMLHFLPAGTGCQPADPLVGEWRGTFAFPQPRIPLVLALAGEGLNLGATLQTPSTDATNHPVDSVSYKDGVLAFHQSTMGMDFTGTISGGTTLTGTLTVNGDPQPLVLTLQMRMQ